MKGGILGKVVFRQEEKVEELIILSKFAYFQTTDFITVKLIGK